MYVVLTLSIPVYKRHFLLERLTNLKEINENKKKPNSVKELLELPQLFLDYVSRKYRLVGMRKHAILTSTFKLQVQHKSVQLSPSLSYYYKSVCALQLFPSFLCFRRRVNISLFAAATAGQAHITISHKPFVCPSDKCSLLSAEKNLSCLLVFRERIKRSSCFHF